MTSDEPSAVQTKIAATLARRPECFITHPSELRLLQRMTPAELQDFALNNGWSVVRRLGGKQFQFYNDTYARWQRRESERA